MKRATLLFAICVFSCVLVESASATPCSSAQYDMMTWFTMGSSWSTEYHLTGNANPLYTYRGNAFYWVKEPPDIPGTSTTTTTITFTNGPPNTSGAIPPATKLSAVLVCLGRRVACTCRRGESTAQNLPPSRGHRHRTPSMAAAAGRVLTAISAMWSMKFGGRPQ